MCRNLKCSIGIGPTKFLAKMASDMKKPLGIVVLRRSDIPKKLWPLSIDDMFGIGKKKTPILKKHGIQTIGDLALTKNEPILRQILGKHSYNIIEAVNGRGSDEINYSRSVKSLSQSTTMNEDVSEYETICTILRELSEELSKRCKKHNVKGKLISISIRYYDFRNAVRSINIDTYCDDASAIYENALFLFDENYEEIPVRHLGISIGSLYSSSSTFEQLNLFYKPKINKKDVLTELNKHITGKKLIYASQVLKEHHHED